jgi:hypothetical protein
VIFITFHSLLPPLLGRKTSKPTVIRIIPSQYVLAKSKKVPGILNILGRKKIEAMMASIIPDMTSLTDR